MFGPRIPTFSFNSLLGGLSRTLGVINQVIPLYKEVTPMINNAKNAFNLIKEFSNTSITKTKDLVDNNIKPKMIEIKNTNTPITLSQNNRPTFFQ